MSDQQKSRFSNPDLRAQFETAEGSLEKELPPVFQLALQGLALELREDAARILSESRGNDAAQL